MHSDGSTSTALPLQDVRVLAISPTPTHPTTAGNRARYRSVLERLQEQGATIRLLHVNHEPGDLAAMDEAWNGGARQLPFTLPEPRHARWNRFAARCRKYLGLPMNTRIDVDDWCDPGIEPAFTAEVAEFRPDAVVMLYLWYSSVLASLPRTVLRVLDAQDVFTDRNSRMQAAGIAQQWYSVTAAQEARGLNRFDVILAIQEHEKEHYRSLSKVPVVTVGHFLPILDTGSLPSTDTLLIIGSDNQVNVHGVGWFLREVWPNVRAARPAATLRLVGRICEHVPPTEGVELCGVVENLVDAYADSALVVNPLQGGTGLKIKGAEALGAGRVVISTPSAALGLEAAFDEGMVVCASASEMQSAIIGLLEDRTRLATLSEAARRFAHRWNEGYQRNFDAVFAPLRKSPDRPRTVPQDVATASRHTPSFDTSTTPTP